MHTIVASIYIFHLSVQRLENLKMSVVYCGAPLQYLCDPICLDNPKNNTALLYITDHTQETLEVFGICWLWHLLMT